VNWFQSSTERGSRASATAAATRISRYNLTVSRAPFVGANSACCESASANLTLAHMYEARHHPAQGGAPASAAPQRSSRTARPTHARAARSLSKQAPRQAVHTTEPKCHLPCRKTGAKALRHRSAEACSSPIGQRYEIDAVRISPAVDDTTRPAVESLHQRTTHARESQPEQQKPQRYIPSTAVTPLFSSKDGKAGVTLWSLAWTTYGKV